MTDYLTFDKERRQYRYQRPLDKALAPLYGRKLLRHWLGGDKEAATVAARRLAALHDGHFAELLGKLV